MQLTLEQLEAADSGQVVELTADGKAFVLLSRAAYDQVRHLELREIPSPLTTARLIREAMAEDDADDPILDSYQEYKRHS
jgi:hypothetical protein